MQNQQMSKMLTALFIDHISAMRAYEWLKEQGFTKNDISLVMSDKTAVKFHAVEGDDKVEDKDRSSKGSYTTGIVGATVGAGLVATIAAGLGFLAGGPLGAALAASIPGAMVGGLVGGLVGYGFPEETAKQYEAAIQEGGVAIGVHPKSSEQAEAIKTKFEGMAARNIVIV
jgi:hypothetical protein